MWSLTRTYQTKAQESPLVTLSVHIQFLKKLQGIITPFLQTKYFTQEKANLIKVIATKVSVTCCRQHFKNSISNIQHCHHLSSISTQYAKENLHWYPQDSPTGCEVAESLCFSLMLSFTRLPTTLWHDIRKVIATMPLLQKRGCKASTRNIKSATSKVKHKYSFILLLVKAIC